MKLMEQKMLESNKKTVDAASAAKAIRRFI